MVTVCSYSALMYKLYPSLRTERVGVYKCCLFPDNILSLFLYLSLSLSLRRVVAFLFFYYFNSYLSRFWPRWVLDSPLKAMLHYNIGEGGFSSLQLRACVYLCCYLTKGCNTWFSLVIFSSWLFLLPPTSGAAFCVWLAWRRLSFSLSAFIRDGPRLWCAAGVARDVDPIRT